MVGVGVRGLQHRELGYNVALMVWVFDSTGSAAWAGAVSLARFVPALFFSAYGGVLAERFERRNLIVTLNLTSAAPTSCWHWSW